MFSGGFNFSYFKNEKHKFANIELDALLSQDITLTNIISEHPLETGDILNDAIHNQPLELSFTGVVSDMPQTTIEQVKGGLTSVDAILSNLGLKKLKTSKSLRAWQELLFVWRDKKLVTISSPLQSEVFEDMAIKNISVSVEDSESLTFSVSLKRVLISENIEKIELADEVGKQSERR